MNFFNTYLRDKWPKKVLVKIHEEIHGQLHEQLHEEIHEGIHEEIHEKNHGEIHEEIHEELHVEIREDVHEEIHWRNSCRESKNWWCCDQVNVNLDEQFHGESMKTNHDHSLYGIVAYSGRGPLHLDSRFQIGPDPC